MTLINRDEILDKAYEKLAEIAGDGPVDVDRFLKEEPLREKLLDVLIGIEKEVVEDDIYELLEEAYSICADDKDEVLFMLHAVLPGLYTPTIVPNSDCALFLVKSWGLLATGLMEEIKSLNAELERSQTTINYISDKLLKATEGIRTEQR